MTHLFKNIFRSIVTVFTVTMFFSCEDNFREIQKINLTSLSPAGVGEDIRLVYTDSARVRAILTSPRYQDYSNRSFEFAEFPDGVMVEFFDDNNNKSVIKADYGILYNQTNLVDLQGNVELVTHDGVTLRTSQLYWDQKNEWIFTEKRFKFTSEDFDVDAERLDANRNFTTFFTGEGTGDVNVDEN